MFKWLALWLCGFVASTPVNIFVDPKGDDSSVGSFEFPLRTFAGAKKRAQNLRKDSADGIKVQFRGGTYLHNTLTLTAEDSGTLNSPILYTNYKEEDVRIVGGLSVDRWMQSSFHPQIFQADLRKLGMSQFEGAELFFDNKAMTLARYPNTGWLHIHSVTDGRNHTEFVFDGKHPLNWVNIPTNPRPRVNGYLYWDFLFTSIDIQMIISKADASPMRVGDGDGVIVATEKRYGFRSQRRYYVDNLLMELDSPGEYWLDHNSGILYFWPPHDMVPGSAWVSFRPHCLNIFNASHLHFRNLQFLYYLDDIVTIKGGSNILLENCTMANSGVNALWITNSPSSGLMGCTIFGTGHGGVILEGGDRRTLQPSFAFAVGNTIHDIARNARTYHPALYISGVGHHVKDNTFYNIAHCALELLGNNHLIDGNTFRDISYECGDCGAIMASRSFSYRGNVISNNNFRNVWSPFTAEESVRAIFLDDYASGFVIWGNIFWNCSDAVLLGGGRQNKVHYNQFYHSTTCVYISQRGMSEDCKHNGSFNSDLLNFQFSRPPWRAQYPNLAEMWNVTDDLQCSPILNSIVGNTCDKTCDRFTNIALFDLHTWFTEFERNDLQCDTEKKFQRKLVIFAALGCLSLLLVLLTSNSLAFSIGRIRLWSQQSQRVKTSDAGKLV